MSTIIEFLINNWASVSAIVAAIGLRLFPTEKNYDIFSKILKLLDLIVPNIKKGGGRHVAKLILFFALAFVYVESFAQLNTRTRQIRFATGVQYASDTAETVSNGGRFWYDFNTDRFRINENGENKFVGGGGGAFWALTGTSVLTGNTTINGNSRSLDFNFLNSNIQIANSWVPLGAGLYSVQTTNTTTGDNGYLRIRSDEVSITRNSSDGLVVNNTDGVLLQSSGSDISINSNTNDVNVQTSLFTINTDKIQYSTSLGLRIKQVATNQIFLAQNSSGGSVIDATDGTIVFSGTGAQRINIEVGDEQRIQADNPTAGVDDFIIKGANGTVTNIHGDDLAISGGNGASGLNGNAGDVNITPGTPTGTGIAGTINMTGNIDLTPATSASELYFGTFTPSGTGVANTTNVTPSADWKYYRIGNLVHVKGRVSVTTSAAAGTVTTLRVTLPISSNLASTSDCYGSGTNWNTDISATTISADITNDQAQLDFESNVAGARIIDVDFMYEIL